MADDIKIREALLDRDGSCRDVNFANPSWEGVGNLRDWVRSQYSGLEIATYFPTSVTEPTWIPQQRGENSHILASQGKIFIRLLQVFISREEDDSPFVELTFFPQDVEDIPDLAARFCDLADSWARLLQATQYFVRYENASWQFGDCGDRSGVIFSKQCSPDTP